MALIACIVYMSNVLLMLLESTRGDYSGDAELPSIWPEIRAKDRSYHLLYRLNMLHSNEVSDPTLLTEFCGVDLTNLRPVFDTRRMGIL